MRSYKDKYDSIADILYQQDLSHLGQYAMLKDYNLTPQEIIIIQHRLMKKRVEEEKKQEDIINNTMNSKEIQDHIKKEITKAIDSIIK